MAEFKLIIEAVSTSRSLVEITKFPAVSQISPFPVQVTHQRSGWMIQAAGVKRLTDIKPFDVALSSGEKLGLGMKSMAQLDLPKSRR